MMKALRGSLPARMDAPIDWKLSSDLIIKISVDNAAQSNRPGQVGIEDDG